MQFYFRTDNVIRGIVAELIDGDPYNKISVEIWIGESYSGSYDILHSFDIEDDYLGKTTSVFKTAFKPLKTSEIIKINVKTKLLHNDQITMKLLTST